jgi:hypothetical protein
MVIRHTDPVRRTQEVAKVADDKLMSRELAL